MRPLRDAGAARDPLLNPLFLATLGGTLLAYPLFAALVARFPRRVFVPVAIRFFAVNLLAFCALFVAGVDRTNVSRAFYVWLSVFNLFVVSVFWGFMADLWRNDQAKRLFGFIGVGGTLGAIAGAGATTALAGRVRPDLLLLLAAALLEASAFCVRRLARHFGLERPAIAAPEVPDAAPDDRFGGFRRVLRSPWLGIRLVLRSSYLLGVCLFILLFTVSSTLVYFQQAKVASEIADAGRRTVFFARIDLWTQSLTLVLQALLAGRLLAKLGVGGTLALFPALSLAGFAALARWPSANLLAGFQISRRAVEYGVSKPAREVLFTVVPREEKYVSKNFVDTFVYRFGDVLGAGIDLGMKRLQLGLGAVALSFVPCTILWIAVALWLGRRQRALAARPD